MDHCNVFRLIDTRGWSRFTCCGVDTVERTTETESSLSALNMARMLCNQFKRALKKEGFFFSLLFFHFPICRDVGPSSH